MKIVTSEGKRYWLKVLLMTIYIVVLMVLLIVTIIQSGQCFWNYVGEPTYQESRWVPQSEAKFPAMTFCPLNTNVYKEDVLKVSI